MGGIWFYGVIQGSGQYRIVALTEKWILELLDLNGLKSDIVFVFSVNMTVKLLCIKLFVLLLKFL